MCAFCSCPTSVKGRFACAIKKAAIDLTGLILIPRHFWMWSETVGISQEYGHPLRGYDHSPSEEPWGEFRLGGGLSPFFLSLPSREGATKQKEQREHFPQTPAVSFLSLSLPCPHQLVIKTHSHVQWENIYFSLLAPELTECPHNSKSDHNSRVMYWKPCENTGRSTNCVYIINSKLIKH